MGMKFFQLGSLKIFIMLEILLKGNRNFNENESLQILKKEPVRFQEQRF